MGAIKISELNSVENLTTSDILPIVNEDETKKISIEKLTEILATKTYVNEQIGKLADMGFTPVVVDTLPTEDIQSTTLYLVPAETSSDSNVYEEYIYVNNDWEYIGTTAVDLSNYYTKTEVDDLLNNLPSSGENESQIYVLETSNALKYSNVNLTDVYDRIGEIMTDYMVNNKPIPTFRLVYTNPTGSTKYDLLFEFESNSGLVYYYRCLNWETKVAQLTLLNIFRLQITLTEENGEYICSQAEYSRYGIRQYIDTSNAASFTPTSNYHPATKKYVDDAITSAITTVLEAEY